MSLRGIVTRKGKAKLKLKSLLLVRRAPKFCFCTSTNFSQNEENTELKNVAENGAREAAFIDYSVLPFRKKKLEAEYEETSTDENSFAFSKQVEVESGISKSMIRNFLH